MRIFILLLTLFLAACSAEKGNINGEPLSQHGQPAPQLSSDSSTKKILIFGGTSGIGLALSELALSRGHQVTSITRRPERMPLAHPKLSNLAGDITKIDTYREVFAGQDAIVSTIGLGPGRKPVTVYSAGMQQVLIAMQEQGLSRVLTVTGIGAGDSKGHGGFFYDNILNPLMLKEDYKDKTRQEALLTASDADWTIVRPGFLTDDPARNNYSVLNNMAGFTSGSIPRADVAHFLLAAIEQATFKQETVFLSE